MQLTHCVIACLLVGCGGAAAPSSPVAAQSATSTARATVVVHYPAGWGHDVTVRGTGPLSWDAGTALTWTDGDAWTASFDLAGDIELKPLLDDATWAKGPNWTLSPGQTLDLWPHFFHDAGALSTIDAFHSNVLGDDRRIWIYLPPSYDENPGERYPVVYMHDGQNLFYDEDSFSGVSWNVAGAMDQGAADASIHEAIVVGIDNDANRTWEYTPVYDPSEQDGGGADRYLSFIVDELKPQIDGTLRTFGDAQHTAIVGSSLGGLVSVYAGVTRGGTFGLVGALSPSTWWDGAWIVGEVQGMSGPRPSRVYVDSGDAGDSNDDVDNTTRLADAWSSLGVPTQHLVAHGAQHGEAWWRERIPGALGFLLGGR